MIILVQQEPTRAARAHWRRRWGITGCALLAVACGDDPMLAEQGSSGDATGTDDASTVLNGDEDCRPQDSARFGSLQPTPSGGVHVVATNTWSVGGNCSGIGGGCIRMEWTIDAAGNPQRREDDWTGWGYDACDNGRWTSREGAEHLLFDYSVHTRLEGRVEPLMTTVGWDVISADVRGDLTLTTLTGVLTTIASDGSALTTELEVGLSVRDVAHHESGVTHVIAYEDFLELVELAPDGSRMGAIEVDLGHPQIAADGTGGLWLAGLDDEGIPRLQHRPVPLEAPDLEVALDTETVASVDAIARAPDGSVIAVLQPMGAPSARVVALSASGVEIWSTLLAQGRLVENRRRGGLSFDEQGGCWIALRSGASQMLIVRIDPGGGLAWETELVVVF